MKEKQFHKWTELREKGKTKYVWIYGVIFWGIPVAILSEILVQLLDGNYSFGFLYNNDFYYKFLGRLIIFSIAGIFYGLSSWKSNEKKWNVEKYKYSKKKRKD
ncbi:hypothetical protein GOQ27_03375 [Clostridium sp. D2Q-11]|uniref:Uncharacterized protein n=1 Tax=Anaeromonas frigoriresistens TaxID=2683708 RepID=A0A942Z5J0_9FIRM|nr:hypothetical protein [Anaeromonas frigoriresistens]MBS4537486.1 hypothetical protein [Anaeromonas frigoriresistens]